MLRVMTYNIRVGGEDAGQRGVPWPARLDRIVRVVNEQRPDLLALQELRGFRPGGRLTRFAAQVGMRAFLARSWFGQPVAVLVRPPGQVSSVGPVRRPFHHAAQRLTVETDRGPLSLFGTHLQPYSGGRRLREVSWLTAAAGRVPAAALADRMTLLLGDLNSLDPWTPHGQRLARLPAGYRSRHLRRTGWPGRLASAVPGGGPAVDTRAVAALDRAGFVDLFRLVGEGGDEGLTVPTRYGGAEFSGMRLDYILGTPAAAARAHGCFVVRGGEAEHASDHYPVLAELDLAF